MSLSYELTERIHVGRIADVFRGVLDDGRPIIAKVLKDESASPREIERFRAEYALMASLHVDGVVRSLGLVAHDSGLALLMRDIGGVSLRRLSMGRALSVPVFFDYAERVCRALGGLHGAGCVHNDISPSNIVVNIAKRRLEIIDLGIASRARSGTETVGPAQRREGSLAYMSPERTGRMNRPVDARSDLYSLGVTFYELLAGRLPFQTDDPVALVHAHVARRPTPLRLAGRGVPEVLSRIVDKLLEKNPEDRYDSAHAVEADLARCREHLETHGTLTGVDLAVGADRFRGPTPGSSRLVGRKAELDMMGGMFAIVQSTGRAILLLRGPAGVGKTALVEAFAHEVGIAGGVFVEGRFDQSQRDTPFSALGRALTSWCQMVASLPAGVRGVWRQRLQEALGSDAGALSHVVPDLELAMGSQPVPSELDAKEQGLRVRHLLGRLLAVAPSRTRPLVLFLDDAQWADFSSMSLLLEVIENARPDNIFVIVAHRSGAAPRPADAFIRALAAARGCQTRTHDLEPLGCTGVVELLQDTIGCKECEGLARVVHQKTAGNPYFVSELLERLVRDQLVRYDDRAREWVWDLEGIEVTKITDNVVELLVDRIRGLNVLDKEILRYGACLGGEFALDDLAGLPVGSVYGSGAMTLAALRLVGEGLLLPSPWDGRFQFAHDRVQEAALALIPAEEHAAVQVQIARSLIQSSSGAWGERLFSVVDRVNDAEAAITDADERMRFAELDLRAGRVALLSNAHRVASEYFEAGLRFLPEDGWTSAHQLTLDLHDGAARAALLALDYEAVDRFGRSIDAHCPDPLERVERWVVQIESLSGRGRLAEALAVGRVALDALGLCLPARVSSGRRWWNRLQSRWQLRALTPARMGELPPMEDPRELAIARIGEALVVPLFQAGPVHLGDLLHALLPRILAHGCPPSGPFVLASWAAVVAARDDIGQGEALGVAAVHLGSRESYRSARARAELVFNITLGWRDRPLREVATTVWSAVDGMLAAGDPTYVALTVAHGLVLRLLSGAHLQRLAADVAWGTTLLRRLGEQPSLASVRATAALVSRLRRDAREETGRGQVVHADLDALRSQGNTGSAALVGLLRGVGAVLWDEPEAAVTDLRSAVTRLTAMQTLAVGPLARFYLAVALLQGPKVDAAAVREVEGALTALGRLCRRAGGDHRPRIALLRAELARHSGDVVGALDAYDQAIHGARLVRLGLEEALANECAARFHEAAGRRSVAHGYLRAARAVWDALGADEMVRRLDERLPRQLTEEGGSDSSPATWRTTSSPTTDLELMSVVRASQALSAETDPQRVIATLMQLLLESSGANLGSLLVPTSTGLRERASATAEDDVVVHHHDRPLEAGVASARVVSLVRRSRDVVIISDARRDARFRDDPQLQASGGRAVLGLPLVRQGQIAGVIYLENSLAPDIFTEARVELIRILSSQAAISLENSRLVGELRQHQEDLEDLVRERTRALVRTEKQTAALLDNLADGVITMDENGLIEGFSAVASQMFGYAPDEVLGRSVEVVMPKRYAERHHQAVGAYLANENQALVRRLRTVHGRRKDGSEFPIEIAVAEVHLEDHRLFSGVVRDMTEQHAADARLEAARQAAEEANLAKSVFLASMSHEIRTPLNAVLGFAQLLRRDTTLSPQARERVELIERSGSHLLMLINSILEMSKIEAGQVELRPTDLDLHSLLDDIVGMFRGSATAKGIEVEAHVAPDVPVFVCADELKLRQILANLVGNAVKFTDRGGVALRAMAEPHPRGVMLTLSVADTGPGIASADLGRVFEKFAQTSVGAAKSGTGLGLPISREYAVLMGGDITVRSEEGVGTTFDLTVPVSRAQSGVVAKSHVERVIVGLVEGHPPVRVLVVDDLEDNRRFLSDLLGSVGIEVREAVDGRDALAVLDGWTPSLVLTDLRMPEMDGWALIAAIRGRPDLAQLPVVAVSASVIGTIGREVVEAGANDFIMKPVRSSEVFEALEACCGVTFETLQELAPAVSLPAPLDPETALDAVELPEALRLSLIDAAVHIELDRLEALVDELPDAELAARIRALMDDFDYDRIAILLGGDPDAGELHHPPPTPRVRMEPG